MTRVRKAATEKVRDLKKRAEAILSQALYLRRVKTYNAVHEFADYLLVPYYRYKNIGHGSHVERSVHVIGWKHILIGENSIISEGTWLNVNYRLPRTAHIIIGRNSYIGRRNFISSGALIRLGDYCLTGLDCKFIGANHVIANPFQPYATTGATNSAIIEVGINCWLGAGVTVLGNVKIGHACVIGANTFLNKDIPPFSVAVGNPARVINRYDMETQSWVTAEKFSSDKEELLPSESEYHAILAVKYPLINLPRRAAAKTQGDTS
jgi:acetyltransferase-like isoleucine patch superfamily enzyme